MTVEVDLHHHFSKSTALVVAGLLVVAACSGSKAEPELTADTVVPTTVLAPPDTEAPPAFVGTWPLTGEPLTDLSVSAHPAVVVKVDNSPQARPQSGINQADVVYELLVEGITRYALVFHSQAADPVGPVRSARSSDINLVSNLAGPLFAWSGGNPGVVGEVRSAGAQGLLVDAGGDVDNSDYFRDPSRVAPHNYYTKVSALLANVAEPGAPAPPPLFAYRAHDATPELSGLPTPGYTVDFGAGVRVEYVWDAERGGWNRFQVDQSHGVAESATVDFEGVQVAPTNVVILFIEYGRSPSDPRSPMALTTGTGAAVVLRDGAAISGTWSRPDPSFAWTLTDEQGQPIELAPGRTWVALPRAGSLAAPMGEDEARELAGFRK